MWTKTLSFLSLYWVVLFNSQQQLRFFHISERLNLLLHIVIVAIWSKKKSSIFLIILFSLHVAILESLHFLNLSVGICSPSIGIVEVGFVKLLKHSPSFLTDSTRSYSIVFASKSPFLQNVAILYKLVLAYQLFMIHTLCLRHFWQTQTRALTIHTHTRTLPSIAIKINNIPKILCMQCSAVYLTFSIHLSYVHIFTNQL